MLVRQMVRPVLIARASYTGKRRSVVSASPAVSGDESGLSAGQVARRLGVAITTLRTWHQRYGLGPGGHEPGRHRRYTAEDLAVLTAMARLTARGVPAAEAARSAHRYAALPQYAASQPSTMSEARVLARAARRLDVLTVRDTLNAAIAERGVVETWHELASPAFLLISKAHGRDLDKAPARRVLGRCLSEVFAAVPRPAAGSPVPVLLTGVDDQRDVIALDAVAAGLAERGVASRHFGGGMPTDMLADVVARTRPAVVVVWGHAWHVSSPSLISAVGSGSPHRPVVVAAGSGWPAEPPGAVHCLTMADAVACAAAAS